MILEGLRVVDVSRVLAGPYCAQLLADQGAEVIKVEAPEGDENRRWPPIMPSGQSCNFASVNRGKKSISLNLKSPADQKILARLAGWADVMLHSFLPERAEKLGISYEQLRKINPRLIFCSISGYGEEGELANKPGYDLMMQAFSGAMSTTGYDGGLPTRIGVSYIDMSTGLSAYGGILTAYIQRTRTGRGAWVRASLLETSVALLGYHGVAWMQAGVLPRKQGSGGVYQVPYQAFACTDGHVLVGATNNPAWERLCTALDQPQLASDERFRSNVARVEARNLLIPLLEEIFKGNTVAHWVALLEKAGVAVAPIQSINQVMSHPQVIANNMVVHARDADGNDQPLVGVPFKIDGRATVAGTAPPVLDADRETILRDILAFSDTELAALQDEPA